MCFHKICTPCNVNEHHVQNAEHHVRWPSPAENHEKRSFEFPPAFSFPCNLNKEVSHCQWNSVTLRLNIAYMVDSLIVSLDITVIINNLKEIIKIPHREMLKTINLHRFHNIASEKTYSLNSDLNETFMNG